MEPIIKDLTRSTSNDSTNYYKNMSKLVSVQMIITSEKNTRIRLHKNSC